MLTVALIVNSGDWKKKDFVNRVHQNPNRERLRWWRKRRYVAAFIAKLTDAESEAVESQTWIEFARRCGYINDTIAAELDGYYEGILAQLSSMIRDAERWCGKPDVTQSDA